MNDRIRLSRPRLAMLAGAALVVGLVGWHWLPGDARSSADPAEGRPSVAVETAAAERSDVPVYLDGLGTVQAYYTVTITARVDGELRRVNFVEGQSVRQGDVLAQIDPRPFQAALDQAIAAHERDVAQLTSARADLERYEILAPKELTSKQTLETQKALVAQLQAQIRADEANISNARTQLGYTTIRAPIQGRTGIRRVDPGNNVHATDTSGIVVVTQVQPIACIFTLPEDSLPAVAAALNTGPVEVAAVSRDGRTELDHGTVSLIDNQIDQTTGTIRVKATFPNAHNMLWPGEFVNARVLVQTVHHALTIPSAAIQRGPDGVFAYVVKADSTVEARPLQIGEASGKTTVVANGLHDGERVVTSNQYRLQPGVHVRSAEVAAAIRTPTVAKAEVSRQGR